MIAIDKYVLYDPSCETSQTPLDEPGNYIFILKDGVVLPTDKIKVEPIFKSLNFKGKEYRVLYVGIAQKESLYKRVIKMHLLGNNAGKSTLRKSLGCLWGYKFINRDKKSDSKKTKYCDNDEASITSWMITNLLVLFAPNIGDLDKEENELIAIFNPPLNLSKNHSIINLDYRQQLSVLRRREIGE